SVAFIGRQYGSWRRAEHYTPGHCAGVASVGKNFAHFLKAGRVGGYFILVGNKQGISLHINCIYCLPWKDGCWRKGNTVENKEGVFDHGFGVPDPVEDILEHEQVGKWDRCAVQEGPFGTVGQLR